METKNLKRAQTRAIKKMVFKSTGKSLDDISDLLVRAKKEIDNRGGIIVFLTVLLVASFSFFGILLLKLYGVF